MENDELELENLNKIGSDNNYKRPLDSFYFHTGIKEFEDSVTLDDNQLKVVLRLLKNYFDNYLGDEVPVDVDADRTIVTEGKQTFECEQFSVSYPNGYYAKEEIDDSGSGRLYIGKDSNDEDNTSITWMSPGTFPSNVKDFVSFITYKEIEDYKASNVFYDVMFVDSTFTIDGYPSYSISSIFTEGNDTIIQSRTGLIINDKLNMMIVQRAKSNMSKDEVEKMTDIIQSITIKE